MLRMQESSSLWQEYGWICEWMWRRMDEWMDAWVNMQLLKAREVMGREMCRARWQCLDKSIACCMRLVCVCEKHPKMSWCWLAGSIQVCTGYQSIQSKPEAQAPSYTGCVVCLFAQLRLILLSIGNLGRERVKRDICFCHAVIRNESGKQSWAKMVTFSGAISLLSLLLSFNLSTYIQYIYSFNHRFKQAEHMAEHCLVHWCNYNVGGSYILCFLSSLCSCITCV